MEDLKTQCFPETSHRLTFMTLALEVCVLCDKQNFAS